MADEADTRGVLGTCQYSVIPHVKGSTQHQCTNWRADTRGVTPDEIAWVRASRPAAPDPEPEECKALPEGSGRCAYAGPDGEDACGVECIYRGERHA